MPFLTDGFPTTIFPSTDQPEFTSGLKVKTIQPMGVSGEGAINVTTMSNTAWRTMVLKQLKTLQNLNMSCQYDPVIYNEIAVNSKLIGVNQQWSCVFPDGSVVTFWGGMDELTPQDHSEGEEALADVVIIPTNRNNSGVEVAPTYAATTTTTTTTTTT